MLQALCPILYWSRDQRDHYEDFNHKPLQVGLNHTSLVWFHVEAFASRRGKYYKHPLEVEVEDGSLTRLNVQRGRGRVMAD